MAWVSSSKFFCAFNLPWSNKKMLLQAFTLLSLCTMRTSRFLIDDLTEQLITLRSAGWFMFLGS
jgi:hypothetical protein